MPPITRVAGVLIALVAASGCGCGDAPPGAEKKARTPPPLAERGRTVLPLVEGAWWEYEVTDPSAPAGAPGATPRTVRHTVGKAEGDGWFAVAATGDDDLTGLGFEEEPGDIFLVARTKAGRFRVAHLRWFDQEGQPARWRWSDGPRQGETLAVEERQNLDDMYGKAAGAVWKVDLSLAGERRVYWFTSAIGVRQEERYQDSRCVYRARLVRDHRPGARRPEGDR